MKFDPHDSPWFAVWTRSRQEKVVASMFDSLGIPHFLPLQSEVRRWSDRNQVVTTPLFAGYLFIRIDPARDSRLRILNTPGVAGLVGNQHGPLPIPKDEIESIRFVIAQKVQFTAMPSIPVGARVRVIRGALTGIEGTLLRTHAESKLVLSVELIRQAVAVTVHIGDVQPIGTLSSSPRMGAAPAAAALEA